MFCSIANAPPLTLYGGAFLIKWKVVDDYAQIPPAPPPPSPKPLPPGGAVAASSPSSGSMAAILGGSVGGAAAVAIAIAAAVFFLRRRGQSGDRKEGYKVNDGAEDSPPDKLEDIEEGQWVEPRGEAGGQPQFHHQSRCCHPKR